MVEKISRLPGKPVAYGGTMLGEHASWGEWAHTFGYRAIWRPERKRLYLFPKLAPTDQLCPIGEVTERVGRAIDKLAAVGVLSYLTPYVTRFDVAAAHASPASGQRGTSFTQSTVVECQT